MLHTNSKERLCFKKGLFFKLQKDPIYQIKKVLPYMKEREREREKGREEGRKKEREREGGREGENRDERKTYDYYIVKSLDVSDA